MRPQLVLEVGAVIELFPDPFSNPPKSKKFIVVGIGEDGMDVGTLYINSDINPRVINSTELELLQVEINPSPETDFVRHKSFVDCSFLTCRQFPALGQAIQKSGRIIGVCPPTLFRVIRDKVTAAESISPHYLKLFGLV